MRNQLINNSLLVEVEEFTYQSTQLRIDPSSAPPSEAPCQATGPNRPAPEELTSERVLRHMLWDALRQWRCFRPY